MPADRSPPLQFDSDQLTLDCVLSTGSTLDEEDACYTVSVTLSV